jgi:L-malate glycosyltransferase
MKPHILFICNEYPPSPGGGIGTFYKTLAHSLVDLGWRVTVGGIYADVRAVTVDIDADVKVWRLPASPNSRGRYRLNMPLDRWRLGRWAKNQIRKENIMLVDGADYQGWMWGIPNIVPRIIRIHGADILFFPLLGQKPNPLKAYFERSSLRRANHIISSSQFMTLQVTPWLRRGQQVDATIYNMVDIANFAPSQTIKNPMTVASVAAITRKKGVFQLLEAWRKVYSMEPNARLIYYGRDMPEAGKGTIEQLKELAQHYHIDQSITFAGQVPYHELVHIFRREGIIVYPSYIEAHPRAWLEAMAAGSPVIGSSRGPGPEVIRDGETGFLVDPDDTDQLADRVLTLLRNPQLAEEMGRNAREDVVMRFSVKSIMSQNINFYEQLLREGSSCQMK